MALTTFDQTQLASNIPTSKVVGTTTNDSAAAGYIGQFVEATTTGNLNAAASAVADDLLSISLTAGDWDVTGLVLWQANGSTYSQFRAGISIYSGSNETGLDSGVTLNFYSVPSTSNSLSITLPMPMVRMSLASTTTVYLKRYAVYSSGTPRTQGGRISARRMR